MEAQGDTTQDDKRVSESEVERLAHVNNQVRLAYQSWNIDIMSTVCSNAMLPSVKHDSFELDHRTRLLSQCVSFPSHGRVG